MKTMKKMLSIILIAIFALSVFAINASAAEKYGDYEYTVSGAYATITKYSGSSSSVSIPSKINGYTVSTLYQGAFADNSKIVSVSVPGTITSIGSTYNYTGAFQNCSRLQTVTISGGSNTAYIGRNAFRGCLALTSITIPGNYKTIYNDAFNGCTLLSSVTLNKSSFSYENQEIFSGAFYNCTNLRTLSLPTTLRYIGEGAFENCSSLSTITIPEGVEEISYGAFSNCTAATKVTLPSTLTALGSIYNNTGAFEKCTKLQTVIFASGDENAYIGRNSFRGCTSLTSVTIPGNYKTIYNDAFNGCISLSSATLNKSTYTYANQEIFSGAFYNCTNLRTLSLPTTLRYIGDGAFENCSSLSTITIPEGVEEISCGAFSNCTAATKATLPSTLTALGSTYNYTGAFEKCTKLQTVIFASGDKNAYIGRNSFRGCTALTTAHIPSNYVSIYQDAFANCSKVTICNTTNICHAKTYADENGIPFKICSAGHETTPSKVYYTVTYNANGGSVSPSNATVEAGKSVNLPTPSSRSGYTCLGWSTSSSATSASYSCGTSFTPTKNITLYAVWKTNPSTTKYTVSFNANGGSVTPLSITVENGSYISLPYPVREGYTCIGWSTSSSATSASYDAGSKYKVTGNGTLYAVWKQIKSAEVYESIDIDYKDTYILGYYDFTPVSYYSDNTRVATVSEDGEIYGTARGRTYIHAVDAYGNERVTEVNVNYTVVQWIIVIVLFGWIWY